MCTLTWSRRPDGYVLLFNRDERNTRGPEIPPRFEAGAVRWIAPADADFGGTWIAANETGVCVGLLIGRFGDPPRGPVRSRGLLVRVLAPSPSLAAVESSLAAADLSVVRPFRLFAISPYGSLLLAEWDGVQLAVDAGAESRRPVVSASFDEGEVGARRRASYCAIVGGHRAPSIAALEEFHRSHRPARGAYSVCMHRREAGTRSQTRVVVDGRAVRLRVHSGPPCTPGPEHELELERTPAGAGER